MKIKKNGNLIPTNTYILDFDTSKPPEKIKIGYYSLKVETYIPNPLRCFNCQKFGHSSDRCKNGKVCFICGSENCTAENCKEEPRCVNCNENHLSSSKQCSIWIKEKEIQKLKVEKRISYPDAKKIYNSHPDAKKIYNSQHPDISYAAMLKKTTKEIACQTDPEMLPAVQNKSNSTVQVNVDTPPKQVISAPSKPQVPPKPRVKCYQKCSQTEREKCSETTREKT
jgi:hypothetical protein